MGQRRFKPCHFMTSRVFLTTAKTFRRSRSRLCAQEADQRGRTDAAIFQYRRLMANGRFVWFPATFEGDALNMSLRPLTLLAGYTV